KNVTNWVLIEQDINMNLYQFNWSMPWNSLVNGTNDVQVAVEDNAGNTLTADVLFQILRDDITPTYSALFSVSSVSQSAWYNAFPLYMSYLSVNMSDVSYSNLAKVESQINSTYYILTQNVRLTQYNEGVSLNMGLFGNGVNTLKIRLTDQAGNVVQSPVLITYNRDTVVPTFTVNKAIPQVSQNAWYNMQPSWSKLLDIDLKDPLYSQLFQAAYIVSSNGLFSKQVLTSNVNGMASFTSDWSLDWQVLTNGVNDISVYMEDRATNRLTSNTIISIRKDIILPTLQIIDLISTENQNIWYRELPEFFSSFNIDFSDEGGSLLKSLYYGIQTSNTVFTQAISSNIIAAQTYTDRIAVSWNLLSNGTNNILFR
ncbi:MAG: hypothetical protein AABZ14_04860, partial [Candidatus Margulisiibacteriota bacterium]